MNQERKDFLLGNLIDSVGIACCSLAKIICNKETNDDEKDFAHTKFLTLTGMISANYELFLYLAPTQHQKDLISKYVEFFQEHIKDDSNV